MEADLVAELVFAVVVGLLLDGVVCEVDVLVEAFEVELSTAGSNVAVVVVERLQAPVYRRHHCKAPQIKLPPLVQSRVLDVLLKDKRPRLLRLCRVAAVAHYLLDLLQFGLHRDADATIGVLARLDDPEVSLVLLPLCFLKTKLHV